MACSHEGEPALGRKIIDGAGQTGVKEAVVREIDA